MAITEKTIKDLNDFIKAGEQSAANSVNEALTDSDLKTSFKYLIEEAEQAENTIITTYMNREILNETGKNGQIDLNEIIKKIDNDYNFKELLPNGEVERFIAQKADLTPVNPKKTQSKQSKLLKTEKNNKLDIEIDTAKNINILSAPETLTSQTQLVENIDKYLNKIIDEVIKSNDIPSIQNMIVDKKGSGITKLVQGPI